MARLLLSLFSIVLVAMLGAYAVWTQDRPAGHYLSDLRIQVALDEGVPAERGNLLGIQPELYATDYQSLASLHRKLAAYLNHARDLGMLGPKTIVVLPEHIGTLLWARGEKDELYQAPRLAEANQWLGYSNPLLFARAWLDAKSDDRAQDTRLRMKSHSMASDYQQLFGGLAKEFGITLVAGSIILPNPQLVDGTLHVGRGSLYNISLVFAADGKPLGQPQRQLYPDFVQRRYVQPSPDPQLQVLDTPAGRLGVLIGSDSWYPANYAQLNAKGCELIAVPAALNGKDVWRESWRGNPDRRDFEQLGLKPGEVTEGEAWQRLSHASQATVSTARASISVFLRGQFWDQFSGGQSFANHDGQTHPTDDGRGARLINLWL
ncbi:hydrolase [Pseudomonas sp. M47T1]|uniref:carbon-nitrogen hydrolase family protein n=1 Tax=unclassified Pseudomonas TaxID=196821 RepID=UPI0002608128|nr:carbon-nitrogen hydrolase family protein [Pseudomonas sp. M47T1]EIK93237.1 hydrolase [Pseudomonas sp. M47T1]